ncbi:histidine kinase N-terminal 7TM domain-containing protein [Methanocella sp. MCL-LM]|uniref:histidine kinase N-terminal 7TM domain-containing protein n=1 Tax=Methanocella sp. MCL-LM TaxID=3412035 RepID=UPI003C765CF0
MLLTNLYLTVLYGITTIVFAALSVYTWKRRGAPGSNYFSLLMASGIIWALGNMLQMAVADVQLQILMAKLTYIGVVAAPPLWLMFNIAYSQRNRQPGKIYLLLWIVPVIFLGMVFTNELHHLVWVGVTPVFSQQTALITYEYGVGIWVNIIYSYSLMLAGTVLLALTSLRTYKQYTSQTITLMLGALIPYAGNIVYFLWLNRYAAFDPTPIAFALTGLIYGWSMFRYKLFDLVPLARETIVADMVDGVVVIDEHDRIIDMNPAARNLLGRGISIGQPATSALAPWPELLACCTSPDEEPKEVSIGRPDSPLWLDTSVSPVRDNRGQVTSRILIMRDITNRKLAEKALDETRNNFRTLFNTVDDLLVVLDEEGRIVEVNNAIVKLLRYDREEVVGRNIFSLLQVDSACLAGKTVEEALAEQLEMGPLMLPARSGSFVPAETSLASGLWNGKKAIFGISRDVTELMRHEEQLRLSNDSLRLEVEERKRAEQLMESSLREKEMLMKEVHYRVKNNMHIISSLLNLQISSETHEGMIEAFRESRDRIMSMALVHEKLNESPDPSRIGFGEYTNTLAAYLVNSYGLTNRVKMSAEVDDVYVNIDTAVPCGLIVCELVSNAAKYGFPGDKTGTIQVRLTKEEDTYNLSVADDGVGMPPHINFREATSLGFQLVNLLVDQLDGKIELEQSPGTKFNITFRERAQTGFLPAPQQ